MPALRAFVPVVIVVAASGAAGAAPPPSGGEPSIVWARAGCSDRFDANYLPCGVAGAYVFGAAAGRCSGDPPVYIEEVVRAMTAPQLDRAAAWIPCEEGSCFEPNDSIAPDPWVAVVDWNQLHGWAVAELVTAAGEGAVKVRLFDLERPRVPVIAGLAGVSDAHVLAQLCEVAEAARAGTAPSAINLSFGRHLAQPPSCALGERALACEVEHVLASLRVAYGTLTFAAAGNHKALQFPASATGAIAVGNLDLTAFWPEGVVVPDPHTVASAAALVPGSGLVLEERNGPGRWAAPSGSSFATGRLAGWLTSRPDVRPLVGPGTAINVAVLPEGGFALRLDDKSARASHSPAVDRLIRVALDLEDAGLPPPSGAVFGRDLVALAGPPGPLPSLAEMNAPRARPSPDSDPCVPCVFGRPKLRAAAAEATLSLGVAGAVPFDSTLEAVHLEAGGEHFLLADRSDPALLLELERGAVAEIDLANGPTAPRLSMSLRFTLARLDDGARYWDASPVLVRWNRYERQHADDFETGDLRFWSNSGQTTDPDPDPDPGPDP